MLRRLLIPLVACSAIVPLSVVPAHADVPSLSIDDVTVAESSVNQAVPAVFTVTLSAASADVVTVDYSLPAQDESYPYANYTGESGTLTFQPGEVTQQFDITVWPDNQYEPTEQFAVTLSQASGATIADGTGVLTILNTTRDGDFACAAMPHGETATLAGIDVGGWPTDGWTRDCTNDDFSYPVVPTAAELVTYEGAHTTSTVSYSRPPAIGDHATVHAAAQDIFISLPLGKTIRAELARADGRVTCLEAGPNAAEPVLETSSAVRVMTVYGVRYDWVPGYKRIPLSNGWHLDLNVQTHGFDSFGRPWQQQQAMVLYGPQSKVVLGQVTVSFQTNPCRY